MTRVRFEGLFVVALTLLAGCSDGATIVALNVSSTDDVGVIGSIAVTIVQPSRAPFVATVVPPLETAADGGMSIINRFFERLKLPDGWDRVPTTVSAQAVDSNGVALSDERTLTLEPGGAVAAFLNFALPEPPPAAPDALPLEDAALGLGGAGAE